MVCPGHARGLRTDAVVDKVGGWFFDRGGGTARAVCRAGAAAGPRRRWPGVGHLYRPARHHPPSRQHPRLGSEATGMI